ncbi:MAG: NADH-quinone oxidoreductase subunit NuoE [Nitrospiraceae bacterium]|nr:NADH-quinone oxidoreductase subunit NuoE [Nitrospiraceae bacterium]
MLTDDEKRQIEEEVKKAAYKQGACVDALKIVQKHRGWISDEIRGIAEMLDMTPDELDGVATFYSLIYRRPVGKHVILVCDSISCWIMGYEPVRRHLKRRLGVDPGGTTPDGQFTVLPVACLGACDHAPAMMVDDELYLDLTDERIDEILERYR